MPDMTLLVGAALFGYLLGAIPFGFLLTRVAGLGDIRAVGSGNIGATNVLRTGRKGLAAVTLLLDALKGTLAVVVAARWSHDAALAAAIGAFAGHCFPVWLGFRGGKGVATFLGILLGLDARVALVFGAVWLAVAAAGRYSSAAALAATVASPLALWAWDDGRSALVLAALALALWGRHRPNIARLLAGTEGRIGGSA